MLNIEPWRQEKHWDLPYDSSEHRPNFRCVVTMIVMMIIIIIMIMMIIMIRCVVTGRARGNYPEFRVSR